MTNLQEITSLFDNERYKEVLDTTNPYIKENPEEFEILYYIKSKIVLDGFKIKEKEEIKKLFFYYFYLIGKVEFENDYSIVFNKKELHIHFGDLKENIYTLKDFSTYFDFGKNKHFLENKMDRKTGYIVDSDDNERGENIIDFFLYHMHECSELYAFSGEHFPLFKWLINELTS